MSEEKVSSPEATEQSTTSESESPSVKVVVEDKNATGNKENEPGITKPQEAEKGIQSENTEPETGEVKPSSKYRGVGLWEQIKRNTKNIEIDIESENGFYWPGRREEMETAINMLATKRIMFIKSVSEEWLLRSVQRLATLLQAGGRFEDLLIRITKSTGLYNDDKISQLSFGFWINQQPLPYPVVIFISASRFDFFQKFLDASKETVINEFIPDLRKMNLYLVCQIEDSVPVRELFSKAKPWISDVYAIWEIEVFKLLCNERFGYHSDVYNYLETNYINIIDENNVKKYPDRQLFDLLNNSKYKDGRDFVEKFPTQIEKLYSGHTEKKETALTLLEDDSDFISQLVIFCGAFFNELYYPDFFNLVNELLIEEAKEITTSNAISVVPTLSITNPSIKPLRQIWEKNDSRYLASCYLTTVKESGNQRVEFTVPQMASEIFEYISDKKYSFFHRVYRNFMKSSLLTNMGLSEKLETYIIRFFALAARMDTNTHDAKWLKEVVYRLWNSFENQLPEFQSYEAVIDFLREKKALSGIIFNRIPAIISGLLINSNSEYREIVQTFFRLLLNESGAKKIAIIIAAHLYNEYRLTDTFPVQDIMGYFRRTLDEGKWEESFFAYDVLSNSMNYRELFDETNKWLQDKEISQESFTKHFAWLYHVDYILITLHRYFQHLKENGVYELWKDMQGIEFPNKYKVLMQQILSESCNKGLAAILEVESNKDRFTLFVKHFESIETNKIIWVIERFEEPFNTVLTLVADIIESWFYLLTHKLDDIKPDTKPDPLWLEYTRLVNSYANEKNLTKMRKYWSAKTGFYTTIIQYDTGKKTETEKNKSYKLQLRKRRSSLRMFMRLLQSEK